MPAPWDAKATATRAPCILYVRSVMPDKLLKVLKRSVGKPNAKTQILTLTVSPHHALWPPTQSTRWAMPTVALQHDCISKQSALRSARSHPMRQPTLPVRSMVHNSAAPRCMRNHPFPSAHPSLRQILETCIKNCVPQLYDALAHSELWFELVKMAADTSIARVRYNGLGNMLGLACNQEWVAESALPCTLP